MATTTKLRITTIADGCVKRRVRSECRIGKRDKNFYASRVQLEEQRRPRRTTATFGKQDGNDDDGDNNNNNNDWEIETHRHSITRENDDSCQSTGANSYATTTAAIASASADSTAAVMVQLTLPMAWGTFEPAVRLVYQCEQNVPPLLAYNSVAATALLILSWIQQLQHEQQQ
jgi:hypothetical protein